MHPSGAGCIEVRAGGGADWRDAPGKQLGPQAGGRVWGETGVARGEWTEDVMPQN